MDVCAVSVCFFAITSVAFNYGPHYVNPSGNIVVPFLVLLIRFFVYDFIFKMWQIVKGRNWNGV